jgi:elongation factor G
MAKLGSERLRNVVLLSHGGAGKTSLAEAMLFAAGEVSRVGSTDDGTTTSDYEPEEIKRQVSIQTSILPCTWNECKINVIDTPGYADFRGEAVSGLRVADGAVIVVAGPSGVEVGTRQMWQMAGQRGLPRIVFVSKMDRENASYERVMDSLADGLGRECVAVQLPVGAESSFSGTISLLGEATDVPEELRGHVAAGRERLTEAIAEADDDLATKYLEGEPLSAEEISGALKRGLLAGTIVPVMFGTATGGIGATGLLNALVDLMPSPTEMPAVEARNASSEETTSLACDSGGPLAALVFKTSADPFVGKLSYFRVYSGTLKSDSQLWNASRAESERVGQVFVTRGKTQESVDELVAGDIGALSKLTSVLTGDTLSARDTPFVLPGVETPRPVYHMAAHPKSKANLDKLTSALARIGEEDPSLSVARESDTGEILLGGLGDNHVAVAVEKMKRKFGVDIQLEVPKVPYKETVSSTARVEYRHKKQSGGHGQFGHVWLEIEPRSRGSGFEFANKIVGGAVPKEYIPSVEKGCIKSIDDGVLAGYPVVDLRATLIDGSFQPVDSSGISFEIAGGHALSKGIREANPIVLEPIMRAAITVPESDTGEVMGDMNSKRARILGMAPQGDGTTVIEVEVPQAEMLRYATDLRSQTQGRGSFTIEFDHYEEVPAHLTQRIVEEKQEAEALA